MQNMTLGSKQYQIPQSSAEFGQLIGNLAAQHSGLREQALCFCIKATAASSQETLAAMIGEGKFGSLHLLYELLGRPELVNRGFVECRISESQLTELLRAYSPFLAESSLHPTVEFLKRSQASRAELEISLLSRSTPELAGSDEYIRFRTNLLFDLFNEGALRGSDGMARQALLDSFSYLPNFFLNADGQFLLTPEECSKLVRKVPALELAPGVDARMMTSAVDKFPSLMCVRGDRLRADGNRVIPSAMIRDGVHVGKRNIFMFHAAVNIASFIGDDNMIDSHASIASSAQIGNRNKIGSFVSLEGVLSPANAEPVYVGDDNFFGTFVRIGTGLKIGNKNFIGAGIALSRGTKLRDCRTESETFSNYVQAHDLNGSFNNLAIAPNSAAREFNGVALVPGEYILFENSEDFMSRFEGDTRIKAARS